MIDKISYKIMNALRFDGRISNVDLSRKLGISEVTIAKKINSMIGKGQIVIKAMPNPVIMGYRHQAFIGLSVEPKMTESICKKLIKDSHVHMVTTCFGRFDILMIVFFRTPELLQDYIKGELPFIDGINYIEPYFMSEYKKGISLEILTEKKPSFVTDELNKKIISELIKNGRPNYADLAKKLGVSKATISRRISLLLNDSIISIVAIPNPSKIGFTANAYVFINSKYPDMENICAKLAGYPEIHFIMKLINGFDILFGVYSTNLDMLCKFMMNNAASIEGIIKTETFICGNFFYFNADAAFSSDIDYPD